MTREQILARLAYLDRLAKLVEETTLTGVHHMKIHPRLTTDLIMNAVERQQFDLDNPGFCIVCGHEQEGCEPDARKYECEACGEHKVYGAEELMWQLGVLS